MEGGWNYRVIKRVGEQPTDECTYQIHEVYYDDAGKVETWTNDPVEPSGETLEELREDCLHYSAALERNVLVEQQKDGREILIESEVKPPLNSSHERKLKHRVKLPKITIPQLPEKITIKDYDLLLTCDVSPEQYDVFKQRKLVGYLRLRHDMLEACYPDVNGEVVYESHVDERNRGKVSECLTEAVMAIDAKVVAGV